MKHLLRPFLIPNRPNCQILSRRGEDGENSRFTSSRSLALRACRSAIFTINLYLCNRVKLNVIYNSKFLSGRGSLALKQCYSTCDRGMCMQPVAIPLQIPVVCFQCRQTFQIFQFLSKTSGKLFCLVRMQSNNFLLFCLFQKKKLSSFHH